MADKMRLKDIVELNISLIIIIIDNDFEFWSVPIICYDWT